MKHVLLILTLLLPPVLQAQDFLKPACWYGYEDSPLPWSNFRYRFACVDHRKLTGELVWDNDTIAFAEYRHYEFHQLYVMKVPRHWVRTLEQLADDATMTANHFVGEITGLSLSFLTTPTRAAVNNSPFYGRALQLDTLMDKIIAAVIHNDSAALSRHILDAKHLGSDFRRAYPLSWYRPSVGIGNEYRGKALDIDDMEREGIKRLRWIRPLTEQHDLFQAFNPIGSGTSMFLDGKYLKIILLCDREVDSVMINQFALEHRSEFVLLSRRLFVDGYEPKVVITLSDTVTQRRCFIDGWRCRMLLPSSIHLLDVNIPDGPGSFVGCDTNGWMQVEEKEFKKWWEWWE